MTPAREAPACLATLASASWATRSSVTSTSGCSSRASPVVSISPVTPVVADQRATSSASASGSLLFSSACGRSAWTERRASARLSLASRLALSIRRSRSASLLVCWAASSWVTMPVRPWARVSWISRAIRCRSSPAPASRAWVSNWACSPVFSAIISSSRWLASASSAIMPLRAWFCSSLLAPSMVKSPMRPMSTQAMVTQMVAVDTVGWWNPPLWSTPKISATAALATQRHAPVRYRNACRKPIQVKKPYHGLRAVSTPMNATRPTMYSLIGQARSVHPGCKVTSQHTQAPAPAAIAAVMPNAPAVGLWDST